MYEYTLYFYIIIFILFVIFIKRNFDIYTWFYIGLGILFIVNCITYYAKNPTELLMPYNYVIENTYEKKVFYNEVEKKKIFPTSTILERNWEKIRDEFLKLRIENGNVGKKFIQETDQFWNGWDTFELRLFDKDNEENMKKCPILTSIIKNDPNISTAFFSILKPGKVIPSHYGPFKGILRYHLGILIPPKESGDCFISVDNQIYEWKNGEGVLFDETYKHFVKNETPYHRAILFIDVRRPVTFPFINNLILYFMSISPYNF